MSLTEADVDRLEHAGFREFAVIEDDGTLRLRTRKGRCVFLAADGSCTAYPHRPEGCVLYPLVWYPDESVTGLDEFCPYRHEFRFSSGDREWLRRSIAREEREIAARGRR